MQQFSLQHLLKLENNNIHFHTYIQNILIIYICHYIFYILFSILFINTKKKIYNIYIVRKVTNAWTHKEQQAKKLNWQLRGYVVTQA